MENIHYISIGYFTKLYNRNYVFDQSLCEHIKEYLAKSNVSINKSLIFINFENISILPAQDIDITLPKKSALYFAFKDLICNSIDSIFVILSCDNFLGAYFTTRDFQDIANIMVIGTKEDFYIKSTQNSSDKIMETINKAISRKLKLDDFSFISYDNVYLLKQRLIEYEIKNYLLQKEDDKFICLNPVSKENHILKSTSVHVNKYINIKPLIENPFSFSLICYLLSERIIEKMNVPDFIVATSKNSFSIASGICSFLNSDLLIINQISPITSFDNFSTISKIDPRARYAVIEDFFCMGTEVKVIKGILWSHGVNIEENLYVFPVASTNLLDLDNISMSENKIFPLYKLESEFNYKVFTHNSCPVCNDINCMHREMFKI